MSTRATYQFNETESYAPGRGRTTVYIHSDGYEAGAAAYFYAMLTKPSKGNAATQFIRANPEAELTSCHEDHGDTEYRYTVTGRGPDAIVSIMARDTSDWKTDNPKWESLGAMPLREFIDAHPELIEDYEPFTEVEIEYQMKKWLTPTMATAEVGRILGRLSESVKLKVNGPGSASWTSAMEALHRFRDCFPEMEILQNLEGLEAKAAKLLK